VFYFVVFRFLFSLHLCAILAVGLVAAEAAHK